MKMSDTITLQELKSHLWKSENLLRGRIDNLTPTTPVLPAGGRVSFFVSAAPLIVK